MPYDLQGVFVEACDCSVICPCWFDLAPDEDRCTGLIAWHIERGNVDRIDVSDLTVLSVSFHEGRRSDAHARVRLYIDVRATESQERVLVGAFTGRKGGPLGELATITGDVIAVERAEMVFHHNAGATAVSSGSDVSVDLTPLVGATGRITTLADSSLSRLLGNPAEVGVSGRFRVDIAEDGFDLEVGQRSANRGRFAYVMTGWPD